MSLVTEGRQILFQNRTNSVPSETRYDAGQCTRKGSLQGFLHRHAGEPGSHGSSFSPVFNTVPSHRLIILLKNCGFGGKVLCSSPEGSGFQSREPAKWNAGTVQNRTQEENENKSEYRGEKNKAEPE